MKYGLVLVIAAVSMAASGCARFASVPGDYRVSGYSQRPEEMVRTASDAYVQQQLAQTYDYAVRAGLAYPYEGGYAGTDAEFFYPGGMVQVAPPVGYIPGGEQPATVEQVEMVRETAEEAETRATDSLRLLRGHRDWHREHAGH